MSIRLNVVAAPLAACFIGLLPVSVVAQTKLLRFPDIPGDRVASATPATSGRRRRRAAPPRG